MKYLYLLPLLFLAACSNNKSANSSLFVIDLTKEYPVREVNLYDIAEVEYIPLETTDSSLITSYCYDYHISDKYIVIMDQINGDIFFLTGKASSLRK